jgi:hypothetical protein
MGILDRLLKNKPSVITQQPSKVYPLGLHPNATVRFDPTTFILAEDSLEISNPTSTDWYVKAIGEFKISDISYFNFYLQNIDNKELILQVEQMGVSTNIKLFENIDEIFRSTPQDWDVWLNSKDGLIGCIDITLPDGPTYYRVIQSSGKPRINPIHTIESIIAADGNKTTVIRDLMFYNRIIKIDSMNIVEDLIVSANTDSEGSLISINVGITFLPAALTIF